jgi:hypothetical protein
VDKFIFVFWVRNKFFNIDLLKLVYFWGEKKYKYTFNPKLKTLYEKTFTFYFIELLWVCRLGAE